MAFMGDFSSFEVKRKFYVEKMEDFLIQNTRRIRKCSVN